MGHSRPASGTVWTLWAALFETDDGRYAWLGERSALWHGEPDIGTHRHRYRVFGQECDDADGHGAEGFGHTQAIEDA